MTKFPLVIMTPTEVVFEGECEILTFRTSEGWMGVLAHRAPLIALLEVDEIKINMGGGQQEYLLVHGGLLQCDGERVVILTGEVEKPEEVDVDAARKAMEEAQKALSMVESTKDRARAEAELQKATARYRLALRRTRRIGGR